MISKIIRLTVFAPILLGVSFFTSVYAHWTQNEAIWGLASQVPSGSEIVGRKYTYTLTSYTISTSSSLSGWTKYDSTWVWSSYGSWSSWQDSKVTSSDSRKVETKSVVASSNYKTVYHYYRIANSEHATWGSASWDYANRYNYNFDSPLELVAGKQYSYKLWCSCGVSGGYHTVYSVDYLGESYTTREWVSDNYKTQYRYADRSKVYTYYFKKVQAGKENISII